MSEKRNASAELGISSASRGPALRRASVALDVTREPSTFFNLPRSHRVSRGQVAIAGVPYDALSTEKAGSAEAPHVIRQWSTRIGKFPVRDPTRADVLNGIGVDLGDLHVNRFDHRETYRCIHQAAKWILRHGAIPLFVGGDHSITYPSVVAQAETHSDLVLIHFDAHHDATAPSDWRCEYNHGTFIRNLVAGGHLAGPQVLQIGVRDYQWSSSGIEFVRDQGVKVIYADDVTAGDHASLRALLKDYSGRSAYITFDIDVVDPAFAPGTGEPMIAGLTSREAIAALRLTLSSGIRVVGADLVEVVPQLDPSGRTSALAVHLLLTLFYGINPSASSRATR